MVDEPAEVKVPGLEPTFRRLDDPDVPWQQVRAVRLADGTVASVREKWLALGDQRIGRESGLQRLRQSMSLAVMSKAVTRQSCAWRCRVRLSVLRRSWP